MDAVNSQNMQYAIKKVPGRSLAATKFARLVDVSRLNYAALNGRKGTKAERSRFTPDPQEESSRLRLPGKKVISLENFYYHIILTLLLDSYRLV